MEVNIKTRTPIWTGGVESGKCDRIHETSILGSLRWWMEVLVRGMGGQVCDPTDQKCSYDPSHEKPNNGLCKVCEVFGATGWKRQFRLEIQDIEICDAKITHPITADRTYKNDQGEEKTPTWYFKDSQPPNAPKYGSFIIKIQSLNSKFKPEVIVGLIQFIADYSALGARPQMGFGAIKVKSSLIPMQPLYDWLIGTSGEEIYQDLPSLRNIFLAEIKSKDSSFGEKSTFNLKYELRQLFRTNEDKPEAKSNKPILKGNKKKDSLAEEKEIRHFVMGAAPKDSDQNRTSENKEDKRMATKVKISRPYEDNKGNIIMRVWGWIPEKADEINNSSWDREKIVAEIHKHLANEYDLKDWCEMKSPRDSITKNQDNPQLFLHSLLKL
jgi:CRISPR-associated protein Cmr1